MFTVALIAIILLALLFDYTNGFHDAANAIASAISTRALAPRTALIIAAVADLIIAAVANLAGALLSTGVAVTVAKSIIDPPSGTAGMTVVIAALVGAITWNFITWYFGLRCALWRWRLAPIRAAGGLCVRLVVESFPCARYTASSPS